MKKVQFSSQITYNISDFIFFLLVKAPFFLKANCVFFSPQNNPFLIILHNVKNRNIIFIVDFLYIEKPWFILQRKLPFA